MDLLMDMWKEKREIWACDIRTTTSTIASARQENINIRALQWQQQMAQLPNL